MLKTVLNLSAQTIMSTTQLCLSSVSDTAMLVKEASDSARAGIEVGRDVTRRKLVPEHPKCEAPKVTFRSAQRAIHDRAALTAKLYDGRINLEDYYKATGRKFVKLDFFGKKKSVAPAPPVGA